MCGGSLEIANNDTVAVCEYCNTKQTLPRLDDTRKANLYDRANHLRRNNEFDKAMSIYEQILNEDNTDSEAYWSLVLCRYGVEYVEDPSSRKRIPTVNRAQFTSIFNDEDYKSALQYADGLQKDVYEQEASAINEIQKNILAISSQEKPFDVFICYKETDANGQRTPDSVIATELYHELTNEGLKVFFSRITLEDKLGTAYEPYIFAALNSAKVMVVLGTKPEHYTAVWVRNEWSRYLALIKNGAKKILIPAYKDMDPYTLPEEFSHLQALDMAKLGFMQDLIRGIKKITQTGTPKETVVAESANTTSLLERVSMFLEDGDWNSANEYCEKVLDIAPKNAQAYFYKLMINFRAKTPDELKRYNRPLNNDDNYIKVMRYGDDSIRNMLEAYNNYIIDSINNNDVNGKYMQAISLFKTARTSKDYEELYKCFVGLKGFLDSERYAQQCIFNARDVKYNTAVRLLETARTPQDYINASQCFADLGNHKNSAQLAEHCRNNAKDVEYNKIISLFKSAKTKNDFENVKALFIELGGYKDSIRFANDCDNRILNLDKSKKFNIGLLIFDFIFALITSGIATAGFTSVCGDFVEAITTVTIVIAICSLIPGFITFLAFVLNIFQTKSARGFLKVLSIIANIIFTLIALVLIPVGAIMLFDDDPSFVIAFACSALLNFVLFISSTLIKTGRR